MSRAANGVTSFHRWFVQDVLDTEGGQRLVGVGGRRQLIQWASPPGLYCITFGHFFGCHHWMCAESMQGRNIQSCTVVTAERKKSHNRYDLGGNGRYDEEKNVIPKKDAVKVPILGSSESAE